MMIVNGQPVVDHRDDPKLSQKLGGIKDVMCPYPGGEKEEFFQEPKTQKIRPQCNCGYCNHKNADCLRRRRKK
jgi:hypothetical protein